MEDRIKNVDITLPLHYIFDHCNDWEAFCDEIGLNPWIFNEGLAEKTDTKTIKYEILVKHGVL